MKKTTLLSLFSFFLITVSAQLKENKGIGVGLALDSSKGYRIPVIIGLIPDGAAEKGGLLAGDILAEVNDKPTKNMVLADVVTMITGEGGSSVKLNIDRKGSKKNYNIIRGKYKYSASFYESAVKDNTFCTALTLLMNDAGYDFANTTDKNAKDKNDDYLSKVTIPGAITTSIRVSVGTTAEADLGSYSG